MKKIIFIVNDITIVGGLERVISNLSNIFKFNNHDVKIISMFKNGQKEAYFIDSNIEIQYLGYQKEIKNRYIRGIVKFLKYIQILLIVVKKSDDIIIGTDYYINMLISLLNKKTVGMEHVIYDSTPLKIRNLKNKMYKKLKTLVVVNNEDCLKYTKLNINTEYIPNPNPYNYLIDKKVKKLKEKENLIISIGRIENGKGFQNLIDMFSEIFKKYTNWKLHIYGKGSLQKDLEKLILNQNLTKNIEFKGVSSELNEIYPKYKFLVSASEMESFSLTLIEAQSFGLPVVSYDCPSGPRDIIRNGKDGYLIPLFDKNQYISKVIQLIENENKINDMKNESIENAKRFSDEVIYGYWEKVFSKLL